MRIAEIFSFGWGSGGHNDHGRYDGSKRHHRHGDSYRNSYYGSRYDGHYNRHHGRGLLGILGGN